VPSNRRKLSTPTPSSSLGTPQNDTASLGAETDAFSSSRSAWATPGDFQGNGIQLSTDGGNTWALNNWNQGTDARYGTCVTRSLLGGRWK